MIAQNRKYIDIHTHILPSIDDGSRDMTETAEMLRIAAREEITSIIATPHFIPRISETDPEAVSGLVKEVNGLSQKLGIGISLHPGNELYLISGACEGIEHGRCLTLAGSRYVLCELPMNEAPGGENLQELDKLICAGYMPVLAHPERYAWFEERMSLFQTLVKKGCLLQVNSDSITGGYGKNIKKNADKLLSASLVHFVCSDCHDKRSRTPALKEARLQIQRKYGKETAEQLFCRNTCSIIISNI